MKHFSRMAGLAASGMILAGCATISEESRTRELIAPEERATIARGPERTPTYLKISRNDRIQVPPLRMLNVTLNYLLTEALSGYSPTALDRGVFLSKPISIIFPGGNAEQFLDEVSRLTGYDLTRNGRSVEIRSVITREWTLAAMSQDVTSKARVQGGAQAGGGGQGGQGGGQGGGSGGSGQRELSAEINIEISEWDGLIEAAKQIMGDAVVEEVEAPPPRTDSTGRVINAPPPPVISGDRESILAIRSIGMIQATGPAAQIRELDQFLRSIQEKTQRQVRLDARFIEVSLSEDKATGIDWTAVGQHFFSNGGALNLTAGGAFGVTPSGQGAFTLGADYAIGDEQFSAMLNFLGQYGDVELIDQPQTTTLNGRPVYLSSGEEFGFISSVQQSVTQGAIGITPTLERILIGVELSVTPILLEDGRILINIVPVVTNLNGFDNFSVGGSEFSQPRVLVKQLATQVITRPGVPVQVGGLITSRINEVLRKLPIGDKQSIGLGPLFESEQNTLERRELILMVTPYVEET